MVLSQIGNFHSIIPSINPLQGHGLLRNLAPIFFSSVVQQSSLLKLQFRDSCLFGGSGMWNAVPVPCYPIIRFT